MQASTNGLAVCLHSMGRFEEAVPLLRAVHEGFRAAFGAQHSATLTALVNLADCLVSNCCVKPERCLVA